MTNIISHSLCDPATLLLFFSIAFWFCTLIIIAALKNDGFLLTGVGLAKYLSDSRKISLDTVIKSRYETGKHLSHLYRETSTGGLAKHYKKER